MENLSGEQINALLHSLALTRETEIGCDDCHRDIAEFAELALEGKSIPDGLRAVEHHLAICGECQEEFEALLSALRAAGLEG